MVKSRSGGLRPSGGGVHAVLTEPAPASHPACFGGRTVPVPTPLCRPSRQSVRGRGVPVDPGSGFIRVAARCARAWRPSASYARALPVFVAVLLGEGAGLATRQPAACRCEAGAAGGPGVGGAAVLAAKQAVPRLEKGNPRECAGIVALLFSGDYAILSLRVLTTPRPTSRPPLCCYPQHGGVWRSGPNTVREVYTRSICRATVTNEKAAQGNVRIAYIIRRA